MKYNNRYIKIHFLLPSLLSMLFQFHSPAFCDEKDRLQGMKLVRYIYLDYKSNSGRRSPESILDILSHTGDMRKRGKMVENGEQINALNRLRSRKKIHSKQLTINYWFQSTSELGYIRSQAVYKGSDNSLIYTDENVIGMEGHPKPFGYYSVLRESMKIDKIPFDVVNYSIKVINRLTNSQSFLFPQDSGFFQEALRFDEYFQYKGIPLVTAKSFNEQEKAVQDNGGPESLLQLSRRQNFPTPYGIDREELWRYFDPNQAEFNLSDVQLGATKIGMDARAQKMSLSQLQRIGSAALLFLKDDGRIVALTALDDDHAVVVDRGLTRNVQRSVLETRYSGEALIPTKAVTQSAGITADNPVRQLQLPSLEEEVPQQVTLRNTGTTPVTLQLEYPLLGVTEAKLSKGTLAPGESATLDLKVKWRSILKTPTQNVLVSLQTSDPIVPRLQLAFLLVPPTTAK